METINLRKEWKRIIKEVHDKPKCQTPYPKEVVFMQNLLLFAQVLLEKIGSNEDALFNAIIYQKVMAEYHRQKLYLKN